MLFKPTLKLKSVLEIDEALLTKHGIKGLILDLDNTLSMHGNENPEEGVLDWLA
ncbi:MAG: YqeG family HAD IIIA-type phosphatase, partial [Clostridiales bacterium]|nr:YqeG family HAD IIIA-type phosphatase [Clostridiales bacterium]